MDLIVDTNCLISALIKDSGARRVLFLSENKFHAPDEIVEELFNYTELIARKSKFSIAETKTFMLFIKSLFITYPKEIYTKFLKEAKSLISDEADVPFAALALSIKNDGIWTEDKHFKEQDQIKIWSTKELLEYFEISEQRLTKYFSLTSRALKKVKIKKNLTKTQRAQAEDFLNMAKNYFSDAKYFRDKGDWITSFAAVTYAHAWLDAGARLKLFDTKGDIALFAAD